MRLRHFDRDRPADIPPAGKAPSVRKPFALAGLYRLDPAVASLEEDAGSAWLFDEREAVPRWPQAGVFFDKIPFAHVKMGGNGGNLFVAHFDETRPPTAVRAALAEEIVHGP